MPPFAAGDEGPAVELGLHLRRPQPALAEAKRLLEKGGNGHRRGALEAMGDRLVELAGGGLLAGGRWRRAQGGEGGRFVGAEAFPPDGAELVA